MRFVDEATINVIAGDGGRGCSSFRREKFVPRGGPDGGDGGKGGDVVIRGNSNLSSLLDFRYKHTYKAESGKNGGGRDKKGRDGNDVCIDVPLGTVVFDEENELPFCDITRQGETFVLTAGGRGGRGNARFTKPTHRAPVEFEYGEKGAAKSLRLVLKLLADVGLIGLPNAGKSTLISRLTEARPKIGDYPFTTLTPTLGVYRENDVTVVIADIPGIVEGAAQGKGLGLTFLRHIEKTDTLLWILDASLSSAKEDYDTLRHELKSYKPDLPARKRIVVLNKIDLVPPEELEGLEALLAGEGEITVRVSALKGWGVEDLKGFIVQKRGSEVTKG